MQRVMRCNVHINYADLFRRSSVLMSTQKPTIVCAIQCNFDVTLPTNIKKTASNSFNVV